MNAIVLRAEIERRAHELAQVYDNLVDACPYPFGSAASEVFAEAFARARAEVAQGHQELD